MEILVEYRFAQGVLGLGLACVLDDSLLLNVLLALAPDNLIEFVLYFFTHSTQVRVKIICHLFEYFFALSVAQPIINIIRIKILLSDIWKLFLIFLFFFRLLIILKFRVSENIRRLREVLGALNEVAEPRRHGYEAIKQLAHVSFYGIIWSSDVVVSQVVDVLSWLSLIKFMEFYLLFKQFFYYFCWWWLV